MDTHSFPRGLYAHVNVWREETDAAFFVYLRKIGLLHEDEFPNATHQQQLMHSFAVQELLLYKEHCTKEKDELFEIGAKHYWETRCYKGSQEQIWSYEDAYWEEKRLEAVAKFVREEHQSDYDNGDRSAEWKKQERKYRAADKKAAAKALLQLAGSRPP